MKRGTECIREGIQDWLRLEQGSEQRLELGSAQASQRRFDDKNNHQIKDPRIKAGLCKRNRNRITAQF